MQNTYKAGEVTIASGASASGVIPAENLRFADEVVIQAPDDLTGANVNPQVRIPGETDWDDVERKDGTKVAITAGQVGRFPWPGGFELRVFSDGSEGSDRTFPVFGVENP